MPDLAIRHALLPLLLPSIALAQDPRAPFDAGVLAFPDYTSIVAVGDLDADGDIDAVGWYFQDTNQARAMVRTFHNDGRGNFQQASVFGPVTHGETAPWDLRVGQLDANPGAEWIAAFDRSIYIEGRLGWTEAQPIRGLQLLDFDRDGDDDVVLHSDGVRLFRNDGSARFTLVSTVPTRAAVGELHLAELDGDGRTDVLWASRLGVETFRIGNGRVNANAFVPLTIASAELPMFAAGDIDGDGDDDVVAFIDRAGGRTGHAEYVIVRRTGPVSFVAEPREVGGPGTGLADLDGDGDLDGTCCGGGGPLPARNAIRSTFHLSINDGGGRFRSAWTIPSIGAFRLAGFEDLDGDGDRDLIAGRTIFFNQSGFQIEPQPVLGRRFAQRTLADLDGDGDVDSAFDLYGRSANDATGAFATESVPAASPAHGRYFGPPVFGDFDGDGDQDAIVRHSDGTTFFGMRLLWNEGGTYVEGHYAAGLGMSFSNGRGPFDHEARWLVADLDQDGDQDVVVSNLLGFIAFRTWLNDGTGNFTLGQFTLGATPVAVFDLDRDGLVDIFTGSVHYGLGNGRFAESAPVAGIKLPFGIGDLDGDGNLDFIWDNRSNDSVGVTFHLGGRNFRTASIPVPVTLAPRSSDRWTRIACLDADADGHLDLVVGPTWWYDGYTSLVMFGDGAGNFPRWTQQVLDIDSLVDVDGDGDVDFVGERVVRHARYRLPEHGMVRQYGTGLAGTGGAVPRLGAIGPMRVGGQVELRLVGARGGAPALLAIGDTAVDRPGWPLPSIHTWTDLDVLLPLTTGGTAGIAGRGSFAWRLPIEAGLRGLTVFHQAFVVDPDAVGGVAHSSGLEIRYR